MKEDNELLESVTSKLEMKLTREEIKKLDQSISEFINFSKILIRYVESHAHDAARKFEEFHGHGIVTAIDPGNAVTHRQDHTPRSTPGSSRSMTSAARRPLPL